MPSLLIAVLTLGGVGLYLALPRGRAQARGAALIALLGAGAALIAVALEHYGPSGRTTWAIIALLGLVAAVRVVTHAKPVYSALYFVLVILSVSALMVLMQATFLAAALVIIYAGAILVTYVFVIMLAQQSGGPASYDRQSREPLWGVLAGFVLLAAIAGRLLGSPAADALTPVPAIASTVDGVVVVGSELLTQYAVAVELAGVLLLAAMVGAIAIAQRKAEAGGGDDDRAWT